MTAVFRIKLRKRHPLAKLRYAEAVIEKVHAMTIQGGLEWKCLPGIVSTNPTPTINVMITFADEGPDSAIWESVIVKHPVGRGTTMLSNPASSKTRLYEPITSASTLDQVNEIFRHVLLDPRKQEFEAAMKELLGQ